jgi:hypothetical protein
MSLANGMNPYTHRRNVKAQLKTKAGADSKTS